MTQVTPTRRLAHHLQARHDEESLARGLVVWPTPDIVTWSGLIERMFRADREGGRTHRRWLDDAAARLHWERIIARDPASEDVIAPEGLADAAHRSWCRLHDYRIPRESAEVSDGPEVATFLRWADEFAGWLDREGWIDAVGAQDWVDPASAGPRLHFVGFDGLTPGQQQFVERMREGGVEVVIDTSPSPSGRVVWVSVQDRMAEIETAARWAARQLDGATGRRIGIVVPGLRQERARIRRSLDRVLSPASALAGGPAPESRAYELAAARPLTEQPLVAAALEWLGAFVHDTDLAGASALLRNPFCRGAAAEASARAALDAWLRGHEVADLDRARLALHATLRGCPQLADLLRMGSEMAAAWSRRELPSVWSLRFFALLQQINWPGESLDSDEHQTRQRWQDLLGEFGAHDDVVGPLSGVAALGLLRDHAGGTLFAPQEIRAPLLVIDPETCAGMRFDALWVCGLDATQWPVPLSPDPFLPRTWQVRRGVPGATAELTAAAARRTFDRLKSGAPEVVFSVPAFEDEAPLLPSALLAGIEQVSLPELWQAPTPSRSTFAARPSLVTTTDGSLPPLTAGERATGGARLLELQSACPFRAAAELRLGASALEEPGLGLDPATRGNLVHEVFASLWQDVRSSAAMQGMPAGERIARIRAAIARHLAPLRRDPSAVRSRLLDLEARWLEKHVVTLLEADLARPPFDVAHIETPHAVAIGGLTLNLRVDRVDRLPDGSLAVIDYKTGASADKSAWLGERPQLPQLPLYVEAMGGAPVAAVAFGRVRAGDTRFDGYARDPDEFPGCKTPPKDYHSWEDLLAAWHRRLELLAQEFTAGDARLAPDPARACRYCRLPGLCRIGEARAVPEDEAAGDE